MKLKYTQEKRARINSRFMGMTTYSGYFYVEHLNKWIESNNIKEANGNSYSTHQPCKTTKAFRRKLKNAPYGVEFILVSRWIGFSVYGKGSKKINKII